MELEAGDSLQLTYGAAAPGEHSVQCYLIASGQVTSAALVDPEMATAHVAPPLQFALMQNQPNPFAGETRIGFVLPSGEHVRVDLYDLVGRRIHTLADAAFKPGEHVLTWNGKTTGGRAAPGVYWYRLTTPTRQAQRRMILLP